jgi:hypothetical protein
MSPIAWIRRRVRLAICETWTGTCPVCAEWKRARKAKADAKYAKMFGI